MLCEPLYTNVKIMQYAQHVLNRIYLTSDMYVIFAVTFSYFMYSYIYVSTLIHTVTNT